MDTQVVENTETDSEEPDDARFLAEFNSKVEKQTVARGDRQEDMVKKPDPAEDMPSKKETDKRATQPDPSETEPGKSDDAPPNPGVFSMRKPGTPNRGEVAQDSKTRGETDGSKAPPGDGSKGQKGDGSIAQDERKPSDSDGGEGGGGGGTPRAPNLHPDDETLERIVGGGSVDHVEDVEEGDETAYNAKRWVYASFFNRMKRQVAQEWNPGGVWRREDPQGTHYGFKDRVTALRISLDEKGNIVKVLVVQPSGVDALDDEAIRAFDVAQPFPNPPSALVDGDGQITFDFGFHFTIDNGSSTSWKVYRGQ
jgi:TonB family protein